jgi:UDP-N-acetylmuramyl pentapeptide synthase
VIRGLSRDLALRFVERRAAEIVQKHHPLVIAITGSVGKTGAKRAIVEMLRESRRVTASGYNTGLGLALGVFAPRYPKPWYSVREWKGLFLAAQRARSSFPFDTLVLELGASRLGGIEKKLRFLEPDIGVVTAVGFAHLEGFGSIENVLAEKWKLALRSRAVVFNADDERLLDRASRLPADQQTGYGMNRGDVRLRPHRRADGRLVGTLTIGSREIAVATRMIATQSLYALLAAGAVATRLGVDIDDIAEAMARIEPGRGRMNPIAGEHDSMILDDTYNGSPDAMLAALTTLGEYAPRRRIAVLGSMNELGSSSPDLHRLVGAKVAETADCLVTIGEDARRFLATEAMRRGLPTPAVRSFGTPYEAGAYAEGLLEPGAVVLVKGSQDGIFSEEAIKPLMREPETARELLVRQTPPFLALKRKTFPSSAPAASSRSH